jgi:membrane protease YdiL (CAAX protease family)
MSKRRDGLAAFFVLVFGYTWGIAALYALFPGAVGTVSSSLTNASRSMFSNPLLISAVSSPTLAALIVASFLGRASIVGLIKRLLNWRIAWYWYVAATAGIAALALVARIASFFAFGLALPQFSAAQLSALATASVLDPGPLGEELGWRGFALPRLLERYNGLMAALVLGTAWGVWHLPAFFISGMPQSQQPIWTFMIIAISTTVLMTWVLNKARGSVLPAILIHWSINQFAEWHFPGAMMTALTFASAALILVAIEGIDLGAMPESTADALPRPRRA